MESLLLSPAISGKNKLLTFRDSHMNSFAFSKKCAKTLDDQDVLKNIKKEFIIPSFNNGEALYFCGNSLGLQPKQTKNYVEEELKNWGKYGVEGHFKTSPPWYSYHEQFSPILSKLCGAMENEVVAMNSLTTNLHLLMISFYRPKGKRTKILCEAGAFPSDQYALQSQVKLHNLNPQNNIIEVFPRKGSDILATSDILKQIKKYGDELALIMMGGVNYYTGQVLDMETIAHAAHQVGAVVGFDLAHAIGNIPLQLHNWNVDFAAWCSYKYLNSGPGGVGGAFVHQKHLKKTDIVRLAGWWGHNKKDRFKMENKFNPMQTAEAWQHSNAPIISMAAHKAALDIFNKTSMDILRQKSLQLTAYLEYILNKVFTEKNKLSLQIITPGNPKERGCQLSVLIHRNGRNLFEFLTQSGVIADWREPNVIRFAPVPLYNSFTDIYKLGLVLEKAL